MVQLINCEDIHVQLKHSIKFYVLNHMLYNVVYIKQIMRFDTVIFYLCVVWSVLIEASLSPKDKKKDKKDQVNLIILNQLFAILM